MDPMVNGGAAIVVTVALLLGFCVVLPIAVIFAIVWYATRRARLRHEERVAMIQQGLVPPPLPPPPAQPISASASAQLTAGSSDPWERIGWAVGLLAAGIVWFVGDFIAAILIGLGAAYLTRGIMGLRRQERGAGPPAPPGGTT